MVNHEAIFPSILSKRVDNALRKVFDSLSGVFKNEHSIIRFSQFREVAARSLTEQDVISLNDALKQKYTISFNLIVTRTWRVSVFVNDESVDNVSNKRDIKIVSFSYEIFDSPEFVDGELLIEIECDENNDRLLV